MFIAKIKLRFLWGRPLFKGLFKGLGGSEIFVHYFLTHTNSLAFDSMPGHVSTYPRAPKSSPGDRPLFKGLSTDPYLRAFFKGLGGRRIFLLFFRVPLTHYLSNACLGKSLSATGAPKVRLLDFAFLDF